MVDLKAFVQTVLSDIICGVAAAQHGGVGPECTSINPLLRNKPNDGSHYAEREINGESCFSLVKEIVFDIAITTTEEKTKGGSGGIKVGILNANLNGAGQESKTNINKIKFSIPIIFPSIVRTKVIKRDDGSILEIKGSGAFTQQV